MCSCLVLVIWVVVICRNQWNQNGLIHIYGRKGLLFVSGHTWSIIELHTCCLEAIYLGYGIITVPLFAKVSELDVQPLWSPMFWSFTAKTLSPFPASKNSLAYFRAKGTAAERWQTVTRQGFWQLLFGDGMIFQPAVPWCLQNRKVILDDNLFWWIPGGGAVPFKSSRSALTWLLLS